MQDEIKVPECNYHQRETVSAITTDRAGLPMNQRTKVSSDICGAGNALKATHSQKYRKEAARIEPTVFGSHRDAGAILQS
jgi:hypothetical protein